MLQYSQEEHEAIIRRRENPDSGLTWNEYKSMKFTFQVNLHCHLFPEKNYSLFSNASISNNIEMQFINETVRLANIVPGIFRKAMTEIKFKG